MINNGSYLRVLTPRTSNGVNPIIVDGQVQYKETSLPMAAKRHLEEQNRKLPDHLKKIIEVVYNEKPQPKHQHDEFKQPAKMPAKTPIANAIKK